VRRLFDPPAGFYTPDDLGWLRDETGIAHLELDPWGSLIAFPANDDHETAALVLGRQAIAQLSHVVSVNEVAWTVSGGTG